MTEAAKELTVLIVVNLLGGSIARQKNEGVRQ